MVAPPDPSAGARRREVALLVGYVLVLVAGVWTVVASELDTQEPAPAHADKVGSTTKMRR